MLQRQIVIIEFGGRTGRVRLNLMSQSSSIGLLPFRRIELVTARNTPWGVKTLMRGVGA